MASTYEKVMRVISKKPEFRQEFEIQGLLPWLKKKSKLFATLKTDFLKDIARNCGVQTFQRDDIIMRQGEVGDCFYINLRGKISIFIINKDKDGGGDDGDEKSAFGSIGTLDKDGKLERSSLGNYVTSLGEGFPFGEVALVSDDAIRTATIIAEENKTDLLVVDRALYNRAVRDVLAAEFEEKRDFIAGHDLVKAWLPKYRKQLAMAMYKETFPYNSVLVKQGETVANIYFIISGQVEIQTDPSLHQYQYPKLYKLLEDERDKLIKEMKQKQGGASEKSEQPLRKRDNSKLLKMCYLMKNESLGELEVLMDMDSYMTSAICTEKTEVLVLEMKHYERLFVKRHQRTIQYMRKAWEVKLNTRTLIGKDRNEIKLLNLIRMQLHLMHHPPPVDPLEKKKVSSTSVHNAEKLFFTHQGPLFDIDGPGSVFYMIRAREKTRLKLKAHQKEKGNRQEKKHVHAIRLPQTLMMTAQLTGATETVEQKHVPFPNAVQSKPLGSNEIDAVAQQNVPHSFHLEDISRPSGQLFTDGPVPRSFRRIQSAASKLKPGLPEINTKHEVHRSQDEYNNRFLSRSYHPRATRRNSVDENLRQLEAKVEEWLKKDNPRWGANVSKLRRIQVEEMDPRPRPGNTVVLRRKTSKGNSTESNGSSDASADQAPKRSISFYLANTNPMDKYKILLKMN